MTINITVRYIKFTCIITQIRYTDETNDYGEVMETYRVNS
jgi:hypothetical protein